MDADALQRAFARALTDHDAALPPGLVGSPARFNVHRNNIAASLTAVLASRYPVIRRLVGDDFFRAAAGDFIARHPPQSPALMAFGGAFGAFLTALEPAASLPYLPDIARLEWARHAAYHAADAEPADLSIMADLDPDRLPLLRLTLHPSAAIIGSPFPILSIWRTNSFDAAVIPIALDAGGETVLVVRPHLDVVTAIMPDGSDEFIAALAAGASLGEAAQAAAAHTAAFDLTAALAELFRRQAFAAIIPSAI
ncbi:MAG: DNA-binding domain-containing protein [Aestuariivirgaceae bacterium]